MKPFTKEAILKLAADEQWQELFNRLIEHLGAHPAEIIAMTPAEQEKLLAVILRWVETDDAVH